MSCIEWDIYSIHSPSAPLIKVRFRGRLRKFALKQGITLLTKNATDQDNTVRFALPCCPHAQSASDLLTISDYVKSLAEKITIERSEKNVVNPVLSKLKINQTERYT